MTCVVVGQFSTVPARVDKDPLHLLSGGEAADLGVGGPRQDIAGRIDLRVMHDPLLRAARSLTVNVLPAPNPEVSAGVYLL
jgi:hypothetical protein